MEQLAARRAHNPKVELSTFFILMIFNGNEV